MAIVRLTSEAVEQAATLPRTIQARVRDLLERLEEWPEVSGAKPLRGELAGHYRLRTGDYRLLFRVEQVKRVEKVEKLVKKKTVVGEQEMVEYHVIVEKLGHRSKFYEE